MGKQPSRGLHKARIDTKSNPRLRYKREQAEPALPESEARYRTLFDNANDAFFFLDPEGGFLDFNNVACERLGYSREELAKMSLKDITSPQSFASIPLHVQELRERGRTTFQAQEVRRDGSVFPVEVSVRGISYKGKATVLAISRDITERKLADETGARLRAIVEFSDDAIIGKTLDGIITDWNRGAQKVYQYSSEEVIGKSISMLVPPHQRDDTKTILQRIKAGESPIDRYETKRMRKDGTVIDVSLTVSPIKDENGRLLGASTIARDITERVRMRKKLGEYAEHLEELVDQRTRELAESERRVRLITDSMPALISYLDTELRYRFVNKAYEEWFGRPASGIIGQYFRDVVGESVYQRTIARLNAALSGKMQSFDNVVSHRTLGPRHVIATYVPEFGVNGQVTGIFVLGTDVTDRKLAELALQESERRYRELFEASPVSLWEEDFSAFKKYLAELQRRGIVDFRRYFTDHPEEIDRCAGLVKILGANAATLRLYGAKAVEEIGGLSRVLSVESRNAFGEELIALADGKSEFVTEIDNKTLSGETKHVSLTLNVVPGCEGSLEKVLVGVVDLSPQKELEIELRSARDQLEHVLATNPAVLYFEEPLPDFSDTISTFVSESAQVVLGFEAKKFLGESGLSLWRSRVHPDDLVKYWAELPALWRDGHHTFVYRFRHGDGSYRWITDQYRVIRDADGRIAGIVAVAVDVTERKQLEEKLAQSERLAAIGEMAAMVGHDLRNPLQAMAGALSLLREEALTANDRTELLGLMQTNVDFADAIVRDLVGFTAEIHLSLEETTAKSIAREAIASLHVPNNIAVQDLSQDESILNVDAEMMKRVFINLIKNAFEAMPEGGKVTITSGYSNSAAEITITDTGVGMSESVIKNVWKPFQTTKAKGLGLGLASCKRIIDAHRGSISVSSRIGEGTTVMIHLPRGSTMAVTKN